MKHSLFCLLVFLLACRNAFAGDFFVVGAINGGVSRKEKVFFLKKGDSLRLYAVRKTLKGYAGSVPVFETKGRTQKISVSKYKRCPGWLRIEPILGEYNNLKKGGSIEPIRYRTEEIGKSDELSFPLTDKEVSFGTCYFAIRGAVPAGKLEETIPLQERYPFQVVQVVYRADDSYLGYLTELFGTPFVMAPKVTTGGFHEAESRMGCDCASFAVYGRRRQGYRLTYDGPRGIYRYLDELVAGPLYHRPYGETEVYVEEDGKAVSTENIKPGDVIHFGEQVSVFFRDAGIPGVLDKDDELMQCFGSTPIITTFAKSGFYGKPVRVFRWKETSK